MALTHEDVKKIATLARLRFSAEEEEKLTGQLDRIVGYFGQLERFEGAEPAAASKGVREVEDVPHDCLPREKLLANAPAALEPFLLVPEVKAEGKAEGKAGVKGGAGDA